MKDRIGKPVKGECNLDSNFLSVRCSFGITRHNLHFEGSNGERPEILKIFTHLYPIPSK